MISKPSSALAVLAFLTLFAGHASRAQPTAEPPESDRPPRYQVEVIVFGHEDFDPSEEVLDWNALHGEEREAPTPPAKRYFDALSRLELRRQVEAPIAARRGESDRALPPFSDDVLALEMFAGDGSSELNLRVLAPDELQLRDVYSRLDRLSAYEPLLHGGWAQDSVDEANAVPFDLSRIGARSDLGTIRLHVSRYLHVTVDLQYRPGALSLTASTGRVAALGGSGLATQPASQPNLGPLYRLHAERRILRGEVNYIDHPAFGVILVITLEPEPPSAGGDGTEGVRPAA
jgi:hypothetical protein